MANDIVALAPLLQRAVDILNNAKTSAEILDVRNRAHNIFAAANEAEHQARMTGAAQDVINACHETQAQALKIENQAKIRLADEYDAAQKRGEVSGHGGNRGNQFAKIPDENLGKPTIADLGFTGKDMHEGRRLRAAEAKQPGAVNKALDAEVATGHSPKRATITKAVKQAINKPKPEPEPEPAEKRSRRLETLPNVEEVRIVIQPDIEADRPISREKLVEALNVSERVVRDADVAARYYQKGRNDALEELAAGKIAGLSLTAERKLDVHKRLLTEQHKRRMAAIEIEAKRAEAEFKKRVDEQVRSDCELFILPSYQKELKQYRAALESTRKGSLTTAQYRDLLACLHPDRIPEDQPDLKKKYTDNFQRVSQLRTVMVKPEEAPLPPSAVPRDYAEMMAAKERVRAQRAAQRKHNTETPTFRR
jgi:ribosome-binding protein aMBF1 (putative translation factor)